MLYSPVYWLLVLCSSPVLASRQPLELWPDRADWGVNPPPSTTTGFATHPTSVVYNPTAPPVTSTRSFTRGRLTTAAPTWTAVDVAADSQGRYVAEKNMAADSSDNTQPSFGVPIGLIVSVVVGVVGGCTLLLFTIYQIRKYMRETTAEVRSIRHSIESGQSTPRYASSSTHLAGMGYPAGAITPVRPGKSVYAHDSWGYDVERYAGLDKGLGIELPARPSLVQSYSGPNRYTFMPGLGDIVGVPEPLGPSPSYTEPGYTTTSPCSPTYLDLKRAILESSPPLSPSSASLSPRSPTSPCSTPWNSTISCDTKRLFTDSQQFPLPPLPALDRLSTDVKSSHWSCPPSYSFHPEHQPHLQLQPTTDSYHLSPKPSSAAHSPNSDASPTRPCAAQCHTYPPTITHSRVSLDCKPFDAAWGSRSNVRSSPPPLPQPEQKDAS